MNINNDKGFSLVEIISVLLILAVIFAFVIPRFLSVDKNAKIQEQKFEQKAVERKDFYNELLGLEKENAK
jgi:prepilin-type N-terminal cleavage/methylation domain-containing protein